MLKNASNRTLLSQALASLDDAAEGLASIQCTIDGRRASFAAPDDWSPHPDVAGMQVRNWPAPPGAPYRMLEVRSQAGCLVQRVSIEHATDTHVLSGQVAIGRGEPERALEYYGTGTCYRYAAGELHSFRTLQDAHTLAIFHLPFLPKK